MECSWPLGNGEILTFTICDYHDEWNETAGIYIFAKQLEESRWAALYVGQTDDFSKRIPGHEQWAVAREFGATSVHAIGVPMSITRNRYERLLIQAYEPPLNQRFK